MKFSKHLSKFLLAGLLASSLGMTTIMAAPAEPINPDSWGYDLEEAIKDGTLTNKSYTDPKTGKEITYWFHAPADYETNNYPVLLFMHGYTDGGAKAETNIDRHIGIIYQLLNEENMKKNPVIIIAPQTPEVEGENGKWVDIPDWWITKWDMDETPRTDNLSAVKSLLDTVQKDYHADENRTYVTGLSMGGYATWDLISRNPEEFAAAAPICGVGDPSKAEVIKDIPIWTFHGTQDPVVPVESTRKMVEVLKKYGNIQYTEYPDELHPSWNSAYGKNNAQKLIDWMFAQSKTPVSRWVRDGLTYSYIKDGKTLTNSWIASSLGRWYYVGQDGLMVTDTTINGFKINADGVYTSQLN